LAGKRLIQRRQQADQVLLRLQSGARAGDLDVEGAVLPEHVIERPR